eukprot:CAMPEP_0198493430 /NCGR_PEP_ID=MMETSP1462-20131121/4017_1 /TAXON_ID=1333877 /ORGANISM="Brandtodinium nutriculum, Strain RCC3387" /LENGTH=68 /DNA_ID=CAMNT_0044222115 /DNA_START=116 /DNA_END=322 /DNA_ORIENTATION=-
MPPFSTSCSALREALTASAARTREDHEKPSGGAGTELRGRRARPPGPCSGASDFQNMQKTGRPRLRRL